MNKDRDGIKLLAKGELKTKVTIEVHSASKSAVAAVEAAGGKVILAATAAVGADEPADAAADDGAEA